MRNENYDKLIEKNMPKDNINPFYYKKYPIEVIDMMISIWGIQAAINYCILTAFKYRMRLGHKDDIQQDLEKEKWYLNKAEELTKRLHPNNLSS